MTSHRAAAEAPTGTGTPGAPDDHHASRSRARRLTQQRRRTAHGTRRVSDADLALHPPTAPVPVAAQAVGEAAAEDSLSRSRLREQVGGRRLLVSDIRLAFVLINEARYRTFELVGVPRDQANVATFVAIVMAADRLEAAQRAFDRRPRPSRADAILGLATGNEAIKAIGGAPIRQHPLLGPLVGFALLSASARPVLKRSVHGVRSASHDLRVSFKHRYGRRWVAR